MAMQDPNRYLQLLMEYIAIKTENGFFTTIHSSWCFMPVFDATIPRS